MTNRRKIQFEFWNKINIRERQVGVTTEPTPAKGIGVPSAVITGMEDKGDTEVKDEESRDI